jgi:hypothetical protein
MHKKAIESILKESDFLICHLLGTTKAQKKRVGTLFRLIENPKTAKNIKKNKPHRSLSCRYLINCNKVRHIWS